MIISNNKLCLQTQHALNFLSSFLQFTFDSFNEYFHLLGEGARLRPPAGFAGVDMESVLPFLGEESKQRRTCVIPSRQRKLIGS